MGSAAISPVGERAVGFAKLINDGLLAGHTRRDTARVPFRAKRWTEGGPIPKDELVALRLDDIAEEIEAQQGEKHAYLNVQVPVRYL